MINFHKLTPTDILSILVIKLWRSMSRFPAISIYNGEASITQDELSNFIETARELQIKGLGGEFHCREQKLPDEQSEILKHQNTSRDITEQDYEEFDDTDAQGSFVTGDGSLATMEENNISWSENDCIKMSFLGYDLCAFI